MSYFLRSKHAYYIFFALFGILFLITAVGCYFNVRKKRQQLAARERKKANKRMKQDKTILVEEDELEHNTADIVVTDPAPPYPTLQPQNGIHLNNVNKPES
ncbi:uncharacterized protein [Apostichopus japonicus]|uniref:uncharacterized protein n=1 Tax=Stichopus japonicus TaxID=307972 RepID=UPI003AB5B278